MKSLKIFFVVDRIGFNDICSIPVLSSIVEKSGHQADLAEFSAGPQKVFRRISEYQPDIICYSVCSNEAARYLEINRLLKQEFDFFSLFGGPHPTFFPDYIREEGVDGICRGEGDICFPVFLERFGHPEMFSVPNFSLKTKSGEIVVNPLTDLVRDLDTLPYPDRDIIYSKSYFLSKSPLKTFFAGRGCEFNCSYCFNHVFNEAYKDKGPVVRVKSVDFLIREIRKVAQSYPLKFLRFHDDNFGSDRAWLREFSQRYPQEIGLPFFVFARPDRVDDEYASLLEQAGCYSLSMGIECGNERVRFEVLKRNITNAQIENARNTLGKHHIRVCMLNIIGVPGESDKEILETIDLNARLRPDFADATIFQPYPGTQIHEFCKERGYLSRESTGSTKDLFQASILNIDEGFRQRIYVFHRLFTILVDHPSLRRALALILPEKANLIPRWMLNFVYKLYYGFNLHRRIYGSKIPFLLRLRACLLLFSSARRC